MIKWLVYYGMRWMDFGAKPDPTLGYQRFNEFIHYLHEKQWAMFEEQYAALSVDERHLLMCAIPQKLKQRELYDAWRRNSSSYLALQFSGGFELTQAWDIRGALTVDYLPDAVAERFNQGCCDAHALFMQALELGADDAELYVGLLQTFAGFCPGSAEILDVFYRIVDAGTRHLGAAICTLVALSDKWHGSHEEMYGFAFSMAKQDPYYNALIPCAHIEKWQSDVMDDVPFHGYFFKQEIIHQEVITAEKTDLCLQSEDRFSSLMASNVYAYLGYKANIRLLATKHLLKFRHLYTAEPWSYDGNPATVLNKARRSFRLGALKS
ncbi:hypothetical protein [Shewanella salipaludis]|uniref:Uncharacterized protein n=1 Tax=Shewanella salipaludis TaxID=2723052 RepID=A0A972FRP1_9GAMM|nr:hypothetical protein [Shewanella salipaludis]NMH64938.1 hypothetical protein [Shewanella salipaludis]